MSVLIEVPVFNIEAAVEAEQAGAHRIELCDNPAEGGTTPSAGIIEQAVKLLNIDVFVMIRPRGGNFQYSDAEHHAMMKDIELSKTLGARGVVFGILTSEGKLDIDRCKKLIQLARPMMVTLHRAFDVTRDALEALEDAVTAGFDRILTSGQQPTAEKGADLIAALVKRAGTRIIIMAGSGINEENARLLTEKTGVKEIHCSAREWKEDISYSNQSLTFNPMLPGRSGSYHVNQNRLKQIIHSVSQGI